MDEGLEGLQHFWNYMYCTAMLINIYCAGIIQLYPCSFIAKYHYQSN